MINQIIQHQNPNLQYQINDDKSVLVSNDEYSIWRVGINDPYVTLESSDQPLYNTGNAETLMSVIITNHYRVMLVYSGKP